ncbi:MAG TPA: hypothetical protein VME44_22695 [Streptosporangiaceae bacterium]|nr:hypothetical protein [Streptosporangiaceae bacterium]
MQSFTAIDKRHCTVANMTFVHIAIVTFATDNSAAASGRLIVPLCAGGEIAPM